MIGLVIVSHSARLAEGVCELAGQVAQGKVRLAPAGGTGDPQHPIGTDAFRVEQAIESVYSPDGVLVFTDLGSAVLSAETALEFLDEDKRGHVKLSPAPLVEGAVAAAAQAAAGATLEEILRELENPPANARGSDRSRDREGAVLVTLPNPLGLHARPAAKLVRLARRFQARVTLENLTHPAGPFEAAGINGILSLAARQGHQLRLHAEGPDARQALEEVAAFLQGGCGDQEKPPATPVAPVEPSSGELTGIPASAGIAIGPLVRLRPAATPRDSRVPDDPEAEWQRLLAAIRRAGEETRSLYEWAAKHAGADEAGIFDAQLLLLEDPQLLEHASRLVHTGRLNAESAWREATRTIATGYLQVRAADVADVTNRVLRGLSGVAAPSAEFPGPAIVAAHDLTPSEVAQLGPVLGLCLESGSANAHAVILARAIGIPVVAGLGPAISAVPEGAIVALDGERGAVRISPDADQVKALQARRDQWLAGRRTAEAQRRYPAATRDGRRIKVLANISGVAEAASAVDYGAEGVGVLRTEFLFLGRAAAPDEEEQLAAYRAIAQSLGGRPLIIRTLDAGGDKNLPYVEIGREANPFLGWRGIRVTLGRRDLFRTQIRAILRAGAGQPVALLLPMVSVLDEVLQTREIIQEVEAELAREGADFQRNMPLGVMIEVPAAVALAPELARHAKFFSIGSNDLTQYCMAADRTNPRLRSLADALEPAVLRMIRQAVEAGRAAGIDVTLCGELAADPLATPLLVGLGLEEFSVSAPLIPALKQSIARCTLPEAEAIARQALAVDSSAAVRRLLGGAVR